MSKAFLARLEELNSSAADPKNWTLVLYDQLNDQIAPVSENSGIIILESYSYFSRRPYHKQKLALLIANMRNFALEQAEAGRKVIYRTSLSSHMEMLLSLSCEPEKIRLAEPAEFEMRQELKPLIEKGLLEIVEHKGWLASLDDLKKAHKKDTGKFRMDSFYRHIRKRTGILMEAGKPFGGRYSFDGDNREPWSGEPAAPEVPRFSADSIKSEVAELIESKLSHHPGKLDMESIPATKIEVEQMWQWALSNCLKNFGAYEDAMSSKSSGVFHTRISSLVNIHRLLPRRVVVDVLEADIPLNSKEGFVRQVIGWREFVRLVHLATDGFRKLPETEIVVDKSPGDAGFKSWSGKKWSDVVEDNLKKLNECDLDKSSGERADKSICESSMENSDSIDGGAKPEYFGAKNKLPPAFWGKRSGLNCLDVVVGDVWEEGWSHHITRLMVLSNIATLLDISPRELTDWFWVAYTDAYDWVVEPNVLAMGTHSVGDLMTTKPYVSGSNYINKMSDYCKGCKFNPKKDCPIGNLYWAFLDRHKSKLKDNLRVALPLNTLSRRADKTKAKDQTIFKWVLKQLEDGKVLSPEELPD